MAAIGDQGQRLESVLAVSNHRSLKTDHRHHPGKKKKRRRRRPA